MTDPHDNGKANLQPEQEPSCRAWLTGHRERLQRDRDQYRRLETRWSWIRLAVFAVGVAGVVLVRQELLLVAIGAAAGLVLFAAVLRRHLHWEGRRAFAEQSLVVVEESLEAGATRDHAVRGWQRPEDVGTFLPPVVESGPTWSLTDQERDDLDLYGPPVGLFGLLNRTSTSLGGRRLRDMLDAPCLSGAHIRQRQDAVRWLARHNEQRIGMMASVVPLRRHGGQLDRLVPLLHQEEHLPPSLVSGTLRLWSVCSGLLAGYSIVRIGAGDYEWFRGLIGVLLLNSLILHVCRHMLTRLRAAVAPWGDLGSTLGRFLAVAERAGAELPDETQLSVLKGHLRQVVMQARIPSLCAWLEWVDLHGAVRGLFNMVVLLDLHVAEAVLARIVPNREVLMRGLSSMAELDALSSLACFSAEQPVRCYPEPVPETGLAISDGRHPLIPDEQVTSNSVHLTTDRRTWVITGPNAAGKSTFLRMAAVSTVLAQTGSAVPAAKMTWSPVRLITNVRTRDDLACNESYFLSEVRRLRRMVLDAQGAAPILGLIDEPFHGTNSQERIAAGIALLEHLMTSGNLFLVATHEEILAQVAAEAPAAENYHFQERLGSGGVTFDYRLQPGPATTRTALRILEQEGYPPPLLERARQLMPREE